MAKSPTRCERVVFYLISATKFPQLEVHDLLLANSKVPNRCAPYACLEAKKAGETFPRKSTPRTLKGVRQQYPEVGDSHSNGRAPAVDASVAPKMKLHDPSPKRQWPPQSRPRSPDGRWRLGGQVLEPLPMASVPFRARRPGLTALTRTRSGIFRRPRFGQQVEAALLEP